MTRKELINKAKRIKAIVSDVDGVLTDGSILYGSGDVELKRFHTHDGLAVTLARAAGLKVFLISGRSSAALLKRADEIGVDHLWQGATEKGRIFDILVEQQHLSPAEICCIGDDLPDLPLLSRAGLSVSVPNAAPDVKKAVDLVTGRNGGEGVLREVVELILKARGKWREVLGAYRA
ncbi:MAG: HAD hydrolase family protein [Candidatus Aureabacteria bacterium]|nr:HAD hydrolase family protein [Candidatus Auribacterota bacterium]